MFLTATCAAGRSAKQALLYTEIAEGMNAYGVTKHRHMPEIEQVLFIGSALTHGWTAIHGYLSSLWFGQTMQHVLSGGTSLRRT